MADTPNDTNGTLEPIPQESIGTTSVERRRFLQILGAATAYTPPALLAVLGESRPAFAQLQISSGVLSGSESASESGSVVISESSQAASESSSISASSESGPGGPATLFPVADTTLRADAPNTNEGVNPRLRVSRSTHAAILFDRFEVLDRLSSSRAYLVLRIANNHNNWGQQDHRTVEAWPLKPLDGDFVEGNGSQLGRPAAEVFRATGPGATWNLAADLECYNDAPDAAFGTTPWQGANTRLVLQRRTAPPVVHVNQVEYVDVAWDVTEDMITGGVYGWMLKLGAQQRPVFAGDDRPGGAVEYYSREGAAAEGQPQWGPRLVLSPGTFEKEEKERKEKEKKDKEEKEKEKEKKEKEEKDREEREEKEKKKEEKEKEKEKQEQEKQKEKAPSKKEPEPERKR